MAVVFQTIVNDHPGSHHMFTFLLFALTIVLIVIVVTLRNDVASLRQKLRGIEQKVDMLEWGTGVHPPVSNEAPGVVEDKQPVIPATQISHVDEAPPELSTPQQPVPPRKPPSSPPARTRAEWEILIGGKFLNRIGAVALIIGMAFFLKYAFDRDWITEWMRVGIGIGVGAALLLGGASTHRKGLPMFAQGLVGAGIAILYLSVYATFNFYHLVSQPVAFILMAAVTVLTFTQAFSYNALAVSLLGWLGGFLTPFLLSTGEARPVGLFSYIAMLDVGVIGVLVFRRKWEVLGPLSLIATYLIYYLWYASSAGDADGTAALLFLCVFWLLFHTYDVAVMKQRNGAADALHRAMAIVHGVILYPGLYSVVDRYFSSWLAPATLGLAALYACTTLYLARIYGRQAATLAIYVLNAIVLLAIGTEIQFGDFVVISAYACEAVVLFWFGRKISMASVWGGGLGVMGWSCLAMMVTRNTLFFYSPEEFVLLWNLRVLAFLSLAVGAAAMLLLLKGDSARSSDVLRTVLHCIWILAAFLLVTTETSDYYRRLLLGATEDADALISFQRYMTLGALWLGLGVMLMLTGHRLGIPSPAYAGFAIVVLGMCMVSMRGIAFDPITALVPLLNIRALVLVIATALLAVCLWMVGGGEEALVWRRMQEWGVNPTAWFRVMLVIVTLVLLSGEIRDYFERSIAWREGEGVIATADLENLKQVFLSSGWLVYSIALMIVGLVRRMRPIRIIAIVLFGVAIVKIFFYDLSFLETLYRIVSFIGLGIILMIVSYLYQRYRNVILEDSPQP